MDSQAKLGPRMKKDVMQPHGIPKCRCKKRRIQTNRPADVLTKSMVQCQWMDIIQMLWDISKTRITQKKKEGGKPGKRRRMHQ